MSDKYEISGVLELRLDPLEKSLDQAIRPAPRVCLVEGNYVTHLGRWLGGRGLEGKRVKITVEG